MNLKQIVSWSKNLFSKKDAYSGSICMEYGDGHSLWFSCREKYIHDFAVFALKVNPDLTIITGVIDHEDILRWVNEGDEPRDWVADEGFNSNSNPKVTIDSSKHKSYNGKIKLDYGQNISYEYDCMGKYIDEFALLALKLNPSSSDYMISLKEVTLFVDNIPVSKYVKSANWNGYWVDELHSNKEIIVSHSYTILSDLDNYLEKEEIQ